MIRLFVAIDLPQDIKKELTAMGFGIPGARWVAEDQIHLTLRFIGEVDGGVCRDIRDNLDLVESKAFSLRLTGMGCFPPRKQPRVLWAGVESNDSLNQLYKRVETTLVRGGLDPEQRKFSPHITLARLRDTPLSRLTNFLAGNNLYTSPSFPVNEFHLYSSTLSQKGAIHTLEATYPLISQHQTIP